MDEETKKDEPEEVVKENKIDVLEKLRGNPWMVSTIVLGVLAIILLFVVFSGSGVTGNLSKETAGEKTADFVSEVYGVDLSYVGGEEVDGVYVLTYDMGGQEINLGSTKDGRFIMLPTGSWVRVEDFENLDTGDSGQQNEEVVKSEVPEVELFVMSFCPYGNRAEETMLPVYNLLKDKVDWNINYIVSVSGDSIRSLHGQPEIDQNIREVCVKDKYGLDKFWEFVSYVNNNCGSDGSCWEEGANKLRLNTEDIKSCFDSQGLELMKTEAQISGDAGASGSPTLLINGVKSNSVYQYENPEVYKEAICNAFNTPPEECNKILEGSSTETSNGGSC